MLRLLITLFAFFILHAQFFIASHCLAETTWQAIGPFGGNFKAIAIDPSNSQTVYAGTDGDGGVFKSTNGGASWTAANSGMTDTYVYSLAIDPTNSQTIYVGTLGGVFKSTNSGTSWKATSNQDSDGYSMLNGVNSITIDPHDSQTVFVGGGSSGVWKSTNGGASWIRKNNGIAPLPQYVNISNIYALVIDPTNSQTIYCGADTGLYKSTNGGDSWTPINNGIPNAPSHFRTILVIDTTNNQTLYATSRSSFDGIFKSTNGGTTWTKVMDVGDFGSSVESLTIDPTDSQTIYSGVDSTLFKSTDGGTSWTASNKGNDLFTSFNNGININYSLYSITIDPNDGQTVYIGTYRGGILKSTNGGASFRGANNGLAGNVVNTLLLDPSDSQILYVGTVTGIFKSINSGASWTVTSSGIASSMILSLAIEPTNSQRIYAGTNTGVWISTNGGNTWTMANNGIPTPNTFPVVYSIAIDPTDNQTLYIAVWFGFGDGSGVYKSINGGATWSATNNGINSVADWIFKNGEIDIAARVLTIDPTQQPDHICRDIWPRNLQNNQRR